MCIDYESLNMLEDEQILPVHIKHVKLNYGEEMLTPQHNTISEDVSAHSPDIEFQNVVVADVDVHPPANELFTATLHHVKIMVVAILKSLMVTNLLTNFINCPCFR